MLAAPVYMVRKHTRIFRRSFLAVARGKTNIYIGPHRAVSSVPGTRGSERVL